MADKKKIAFDVGWVLAALIAAKGFLFVRKAFLAQYLGPSDLGLFSMCIAIIGILSLLGGFGFERALVKHIAENKDNKEEISQIFSSALVTMIIFGVILGLILFVFSDLVSRIFNMPQLSPLVNFLAIAFPFTLVTTIYSGFFNGLRKMNYFSLVVFSRSFSALFLIVALVLIGLGVEGAVLGYVVSEVIIAGVFFIFVRRFVHITLSGFKVMVKKLLSFGSWLVGADVLNRFHNQANILLVGFFLTATEVGYFTVALALSTFFWIFSQAIQKVSYPISSEFWSNSDYTNLQKVVNKSMKYTACVLLPVGLFAGFFAGKIVILIFGGGFASAVLPFIVLLIGTVVAGIAVRPIESILPAIGRPDLETKKVGVIAVVGVLLNVLLIPIFGIMGAAVATASAFVLEGIMHLILSVRYAKVTVDLKWFIKMIFVVLVLLCIYLLFGLNNYLAGVLIVFFLLIIWFHFLSDEDRRYFRGMLKTIKHIFNKN
ncbi:MAG: flippase [Halobacteriota archaeon]